MRLRLIAAILLFALVLPVACLGQETYNEPWRPQYHFTPANNFMNDPNGMVFYKGEYHLFYQYNPEGNVWGHMSWGHAVSADMLHWKHLPVAIPERAGKYMIYSGSAVVDAENVSGLCQAHGNDRSCLLAVFTAAAKDASGKEHQAQHLAYSNDRGRTWTEYAKNPIADLNAPDFRDPKVFWYEPQRKWVMVAVLADELKLEIFDSKDLKNWKRVSEFGPAGDEQGQWECPDLMELPVEGSSEKHWVLIVNRNPGAPAGGTGTRYIVGKFDGEKFTALSEAKTWADYGKDFYATQRFSSMPDERTVWMGWIGTWQYANKEPTEKWRGAQSLPRELSLRKVGAEYLLAQRPIREAEALRDREMIDVADVSVAEANRRIRQAKCEGDTVEIEVEFQSPGDYQGIVVRKNGDEKTLIGFEKNRAFIDRTHSGETGFSPDFPGRHLSPTLERVGKLHIFVDRSSVEAFVNDGEHVLTDRIYPSLKSDELELFGGAAKVKRLRAWKLKSVWRSRP